MSKISKVPNQNLWMYQTVYGHLTLFYCRPFSFEYCKTLNICVNKLSRLSKNDILVHFYFDGKDIQWLQVVKKI